MTCKDCIHYEVCLEEAKSKNESLDNFDIEGIEDFCRFSKPKSRYIELPCAVGDTVYIKCHISGGAIPDFIVTETVTKIGLTVRGLLHEHSYDFNQLGKTVFLSREEAEKALQEKQQ